MVLAGIGTEKLQGNIFSGYINALILDILELREIELD